MNFYSAKSKSSVFSKEEFDKYIDNRIANAISNLKVRIPQSQINDAVVKFFTEKKWFLTEDGKKVDTYDLIRKFAMNTIGVAENGKLNPEFLAIVQKEVANILAKEGLANLYDKYEEDFDENDEDELYDLQGMEHEGFREILMDNAKCDFPSCSNFGTGSIKDKDPLCTECDNFKVKQTKLAEQKKNLSESKAHTCDKSETGGCGGNCKCSGKTEEDDATRLKDLENQFIDIFNKLFGLK
jgi:hypothetical protein